MKASDRNREYARIRNIQDLHHQKRLLRARIDHQEVMIMYRFRNLWDFLSPSHLAALGLETLAHHHRRFGIFYRTASFITDILRTRRMK